MGNAWRRCVVNEGERQGSGRSATSGLPELGSRGEGWVALQVVLLAAMAAAGLRGRRWPASTRAVRQIVAVPMVLFGLYLFGGGAGGLGRQLTPFPKPVEDASLKREGAYGLARHPIYGGVLLLALSWALLTSPTVLPPWAVATVFLEAKRRREEAWLAEEHADYEDYKQDVRHRLVPYVW